MKLIHITFHFYPHIGGIEKHVQKVIKLLDARGHEVIVITADFTGKLAPEELYGNVRVMRFPATRSPLRVKFWFMRQGLLLRSADAVHVHTSHLFDFLNQWITPSRRLVYTAHGWGGKYPIPQESILTTQRCVSRVAKLVCVGEFIGKWNDVRPDVVTYGAVEVSNVRLSKKCSGQICMLGRLANDTGSVVFAQGIRMYAEKFDSVKVVVCGDGTLTKDIQNLLDHPKIDMEFRGFVENAEEAVAASPVTMTSGYLGILEALALGSIVLSVADNPVKEDYLSLSPMAKYIYIARSSNDVAEFLCRTLNDTSTRRQQTDEGRQLARSQTWNLLVDQYEKLYESLQT